MAQINKIRNEKGQLTIDTTEIERVMKDYCISLPKQLYTPLPQKWTT